MKAGNVLARLLLALMLAMYVVGCGDDGEVLPDGDIDISDGDVDGDTDGDVDGDVEEGEEGTVDPCDPNPCTDANKTVCADDGNGNAVCSCDDGFTDYGDGSCKPTDPCADDTTCAAENRECENNNGEVQCGDCVAGYHEDDQSACVQDEECLENSCNGHGTCSVADGVVSCECETGYSGDHCDACDADNGYHFADDGETCTTDVCNPNPCTESNKSVCADEEGLAVCSCDDGFMDYGNGACLPVDPCDPNPCEDDNKTACSNDQGTAVCACDDGFTDYGDGTCLPSDPCADDTTCAGENRVCENDNGSVKCGGCVAGYHEESEACVRDSECLENSCSGNGTCSVIDNVPTCDCDDGYAGDYCDACDADNGYHWNAAGDACTQDACDPNPCTDEHKTVCTDDAGTAVCACDDGFMDYGDGACMPVDPCADDTTCAAENRECTNDNGVVLCGDCLAGFHVDGDACVADTECLDDTCSGNGTCSVVEGVPVCDCNDGYVGDHCDACDDANGWHWNTAGDACTQNLCDPNPCDETNHEVCDEADGSCSCDDANGWHLSEDGVTCTQSLCDPFPCDADNHEVCDEADGTCACDEANDWHLSDDGTTCTQSLCDPFPCDADNHEVCDIADGTCACDEANDWHLGDDGTTCTQSLCDPFPCDADNHEVCDGADGSCSCDDANGWHLSSDGTTCTQDLCDPNPCSDANHEVCDGADGSCSCDDANGWHLSSDGTTCTQDLCDPNPCNDANHEVCDGADGSCSCDDANGWHLSSDGTTCTQDLCDPNPCNDANHEVCDGADGSCSCDDANGWHLSSDGTTCTQDLCDPNPCNDANHEVCDGADGSCSCDADNGWHLGSDGTTCTQDLCDPNPCNDANHEVCDGGTCSCDDANGWHLSSDGATCTQDVCDPNPCTDPNKTVCSDDAGVAVCGCDDGWHLSADGTTCTQDLCDPNPCSDANHEVCDGADGSCSCDAANGWHLSGDGTTCTQDFCDPDPCDVDNHEVCDEGLDTCACDEADGWHLSSDGTTCTQDVCDPNPCTEPGRTLCTDAGGFAACDCAVGFDDMDGVCVANGDSCEGALELTLADRTYFGTTDAATPLYTGSCNGNGPEMVFFFTLNSDVDASVALTNPGTSYDTVMFMRTGDCENGTEVGCNDDAVGLQSALSGSLTAGTYWLFVDGYGTDDFGPFEMTWEFTCTGPDEVFDYTTASCVPDPCAGQCVGPNDGTCVSTGVGPDDWFCTCANGYAWDGAACVFAKQTIVHYYTDWSPPTVHYNGGAGEWFDEVMTIETVDTPGFDWWQTATMDSIGETFEFALTNGTGDWDNNGGVNYTTTAPEVWVKFGMVYEDPAGIPAAACDPNPCTEPNRSICIEYQPDMPTCECDPGYDDNAGVCEPNGDTCEVAVDLPLNGGTFVGNNIGKTASGIDPSCSGSASGADQVFAFTLLSDATARIEVLPGDQTTISDTVMYLVADDGADCASGSEVTCDDDDGSDLLSLISDAPLTAGTYYLYVKAYGATVEGTFELAWEFTCPDPGLIFDYDIGSCIAGPCEGQCTGPNDGSCVISGATEFYCTCANDYAWDGDSCEPSSTTIVHYLTDWPTAWMHYSNGVAGADWLDAELTVEGGDGGMYQWFMTDTAVTWFGPELQFVFKDTEAGDNWDNNGGANYYTSAPEVWVYFGTVYEDPALIPNPCADPGLACPEANKGVCIISGQSANECLCDPGYADDGEGNCVYVPQGDDCTDATPLDLSAATVIADNIGKTASIVMPNCSSLASGPDKVYTFTVNSDVTANFEVLDNAITTIRDTVMYLVHDDGADCTQGSQIACDDDGGAGLLSLISDTALVPGTYYLYIKGWNLTTEGVFEVAYNFTCGPGEEFNPETAACEPVPTECVFINASVEQTTSDRTFLIPDGTIVPGGGFLIIGRDADRATFEANYAVTLAPNVIYFNGENLWPSMNNDETFTLFNEGLPVDGPTAVPVSSSARNMQRLDSMLPASDPASWATFPDNAPASPGIAGLMVASESGGPVISEINDQQGSGQYIFEYVEIYCDMPAPAI